MEKSDLDKAGGEDDNATRTPRKGYKRRFPHSFEGRGGESKTKKAKTTGSSSKSAADAVMVRRLGGTQSDPLNLLGTVKDLDQCSSCMSSPTQEAGQPPPPPPLLQHDPLNLEGKVRDDLSVLLKGEDKPAEKQKHKDVARKHRRTRTLSTEEHVRPEEEAGASAKADQRTPKSAAKGSKYRYGNYDKYYSYRNGGVFEDDLRFNLLSKEMFKGKDVLDIGSNTGQVTVRIAKELEPKRIVGIDIDGSLVKTAWKVLHRHFVSALAPDGRQFPMSLTSSRGPLNILSSSGDNEDKFPHNVHFGNFISDKCTLQHDKYDVILALSITKWIHLNWGDDGIKRFFQKVHSSLNDGGCFILEPQPFSSYKRKKKLTETIYKNYNSIQFLPSNFHDYLMSLQVGFVKHKFLGTSLNKSKGFRRPLHLYVKRGPDNHSAESHDQTMCSDVTSVNTTSS